MKSKETDLGFTIWKKATRADRITLPNSKTSAYENNEKGSKKREKQKSYFFLFDKNLPCKLELQKCDCYCIKCKKFL